ncbi:MAG: peptide ABC transporter substrate-binding protein [Thermomicrobiales bacterium]|nr:peptide ABC transporter substrate-binding protein [Thermomicrobiales bacterium]
MIADSPKGQLASLHAALRAGTMSRREFTLRALALGASMSVISFALRAEMARAMPGTHVGWGIAAQGTTGAPDAGMDGRKRGEGGELKLIQWQAPSMLSPHVSTGTKDYLAAQPILEPLMHYLADGTLIPNLITEVPTVANGMLAKDLTSVTYTLLDGVKWADGEPFTADDVVFTYNWVIDPANASVSAGVYAAIKSMEAPDAKTVKVTFAEPNANWFEPHAGSTWGYVYPKHVLDVEDKKGAHDAFLLNPVGTGPYKIESFAPNDQAVYVINENYREPNKPYFAKINLKGGGDAASAARAVLQTGEYDFAWNLQVEPDVLAELEKGGKGALKAVPGTDVERIEIQFADPNTEVNGQKAEKSTKNPRFGDKAVRQALNLAAPRDVISKQLYAGPPGEPATANILAGIPAMASPNTSWEFDLDKAAKILDDAGWTMNGNVRSKDGVDLSITYVSSINPVRQKTQAIIKQSLEKLGFQVELRQVDAAVFFDGSPGNDQNINHFYNDLQMYTNNATTPIPVAYMIGWYGGDDNIAQKSNSWNGQNYSRYNNEEYNKIFEEVRLETDIEKAAEMFIKLNDILIDDVAVVPLVNRAADKYAIATTLRDENVAVSSFEYDYWNIANWNRTE